MCIGLCMFCPLEVVGRGSETQLQMSKNNNDITSAVRIKANFNRTLYHQG